MIIKSDKLLLSLMTIVALFLDFIWISFAADYPSQINYTKFTSTIVVSYILIAVKIGVLLYLLIAEKAFSNE